MKHIHTAAIIAAMTCTVQVQADAIALKAAYFQHDSDNQTLSFAVEHPLPLIPNIRYVKHSDINLGTDNLITTDLEIGRQDLTLYYELLNNDVLHLDLGAGVTSFDSRFSIANVGAVHEQSTGGHLYAKAMAPLFTESGFGLYAEATAATVSGISIGQAQAGISYTVSLAALDLRAFAGYQATSYDDIAGLGVDYKQDGVQFGFEIDL